MSAELLRDHYLDRIRHVQSIFTKLCSNVGSGRPLDFPDVHKLSEGLFLNAWAYWEDLLLKLITLDLATDPKGVVQKRVRIFRGKASARHFAQLILSHPDAPEKFIDWSDYTVIRNRAEAVLGPGHRFKKLAKSDDLVKLKRVRNAIAHRSEKAWDSFRRLVRDEPFKFTKPQMMGLTPGRFLYGHLWGSDRVLTKSLAILEGAARELVP